MCDNPFLQIIIMILSYQTYRELFRKIADLKFASAVLQWDQETYMPKEGAAFRGQQIATLSEMAHELSTASTTGMLLNDLVTSPALADNERKNVQLSLEDYNRGKKLPSSFVRKLSEAVNQSFHSWIKAREENNFSIFENDLNAILQLKIEEANLLGYENHPYDALIQEFDKGLNVKILDNLFETLKPKLKAILKKVENCQQVDNAFLYQQFEKEKQWDFGIQVLKNMHYNFNAGRQDVSEHPFTTNFSSKDVRVTTRIDENDFNNMLWSCIHEGGHALYEQGLPETEYGLPLGEYCSLSIHESQSRLWENCIGRGKAFWGKLYLQLQEFFPTQLKSVSKEKFYSAINQVKPSLIRTEADEITYHFHVIIRYEIEKALIEGKIASKDIPTIWAEKYKSYLGVEVIDDRNGCLQDVHWSHGSFGYFPTYSVGSLYAAQFFATIKDDHPDVLKEIGDGNTTRVFEWLQQHIYQYGRKFNSEDLCEKATGEKLNADFFIHYLEEKYADIYKYE